MNRVASVMVMHSRNRITWFFHPWIIVGFAFVICLGLALIDGASGPLYAGGIFAFYLVTIVDGALALSATFRFAVGFSMRRRDFLLGTLAMTIAVSAAWAVLLVLLSVIEANLMPHWGVNLYFFHLPYFSDGSVAIQFWVYFVLLLFNYLLGLALGSTYQRFGQTGTWVLSGAVVVLLSAFSLVSYRLNWWDAIFGWLPHQTAASLVLWLVPLIAVFGLACYALLRKAAA
jgi:hypothetical protein